MTLVTYRPITATSRRPLKTALHSAVADARLNQARLLLRHTTTDVNAKDLNGWTPLVTAVFIHDGSLVEKMLRLLVSAGARTDVKDRHGRTLLHICVVHKLFAYIEILLRVVPRIVRDVVEQDNDGNTILHEACETCNEAFVRRLIELAQLHDYTLDIKNKQGLTPLLTAVKLKYYYIGLLLVTELNHSCETKDDVEHMSVLQWCQQPEMGNAVRRQNTAPMAFQLLWHPRTRDSARKYPEPSTRGRHVDENNTSKEKDLQPVSEQLESTRADDLLISGRHSVHFGDFRMALIAAAVEQMQKSRGPTFALPEIDSAESSGRNRFRTNSGAPQTAALRVRRNKRAVQLRVGEIMTLVAERANGSVREPVREFRQSYSIDTWLEGHALAQVEQVPQRSRLQSVTGRVAGVGKAASALSAFGKAK